MQLTRTEVEGIAALARLDLDEAEKDGLAHDLASILEHMTALREVDVDDVPPMEGVSEHPAPFRDDEPRPDPLEITLPELAPAFSEGFFVVPRLAALDADALAGEDAE